VCDHVVQFACYPKPFVADTTPGLLLEELRGLGRPFLANPNELASAVQNE
jgi:hypothetical protein